MTAHASVNPSEIETIDARASTLMKRGIRLLANPDADADGALRCFDAALEWRRRLPLGVPIHADGFAACWLNRAEALTSRGRPGDAALALAAYDEAIAVLRGLPWRDDRNFAKRLAIAYQNRGLALAAQAPPARAEAILALTEAAAVLGDAAAAAIPNRSYLLAVVWNNLANVHASEKTVESDEAARDAARRALALVAPAERQDADAADVGLRSRHVLCQILARHLSSVDAAGESQSRADDVHEATDMADDGLNLARHWERQGARFRDVANDLFRFGALVYGRYQPHFLDEFVSDHLHATAAPEIVSRKEPGPAVDES